MMATSTFVKKIVQFNRDDSGHALLKQRWLLVAALSAAVVALSGCAAPGTDNQPSSYLPHSEHSSPQVASPAPGTNNAGSTRDPNCAPGQTKVEIVWGGTVCASPVSDAERVEMEQRAQDIDRGLRLTFGSQSGPPIVAPVPVTPPAQSVPIEYEDNRPLVRITVGDAPAGHPWTSFRCVLDTGSSDLVFPLWLMEQAAAAYGAFSDRDMTFIGASQAQLAGGATMKTGSAVLREVTVGPWTLHNVPVTVTRDGDCLLGMSVLKAFGHPMIDFAGQRLILED
jgi:hypothetical protein